MVFSTLPTSISSIRSPHSPVCLHPQRHQHPRARSSSRRFPSSWRKANRAEIAHRNLWAHIFLVHSKLNFEAFWKTHIRSEYINLVKQIESCRCSEWVPPIFLKQKSTSTTLLSSRWSYPSQRRPHRRGSHLSPRSIDLRSLREVSMVVETSCFWTIWRVQQTLIMR